MAIIVSIRCPRIYIRAPINKAELKRDFCVETMRGNRPVITQSGQLLLYISFKWTKQHVDDISARFNAIQTQIHRSRTAAIESTHITGYHCPSRAFSVVTPSNSKVPIVTLDSTCPSHCQPPPSGRICGCPDEDAEWIVEDVENGECRRGKMCLNCDSIGTSSPAYL